MQLAKTTMSTHLSTHMFTHMSDAQEDGTVVVSVSEAMCRIALHAVLLGLVGGSDASDKSMVGSIYRYVY